MSWKKLSSKKILDHPRLKVYEDIVELPNGHQTDYVYFKNRDAATVIAINGQGKILLQKEYSYPPNEWLFQFPGGALEEGEAPEHGAARELAEEGQLKGYLEQIGWFYISNRRGSHKMFIFVAKNLEPAPTENDAEEEFEDFWLTPDEINQKIKNNEIHNYSTLAAWAFFLNT